MEVWGSAVFFSDRFMVDAREVSDLPSIGFEANFARTIA